MKDKYDVQNKEKYVVDTEEISDDELSTALDDYERSECSVAAKASSIVSLPPFEEEDLPFNKPRSESEMEELGKKRVSHATRTKILWACRAYDRWVDFRRKMYIGRINNPKPNEEWRKVDRLSTSCKQPAVLSRDVCDFITEVRKENGKQYPPGTVYDLVLCISLYLEREFKMHRLTSKEHWPKIRNTLDAIMVEKTAEGLGLSKERDYVSEDQENYLWDNHFLGDDNPDKLRLTVFFLLGKSFGLRGGSEHRDLVRYPSSQIQIEQQKDSPDDIMLVYREFKSKMNQGGISSRNVKRPRVAYCFPSANKERCPIQHFIKYVRFSPLGNDDSTAFYLRTNPNWQTCPLWYTRQPIGKNLLNDYLKNLMKNAGFIGNFTNHSLRATTCTRLFQSDCPEQLIAEQTGHSSNAIRRYKKSNLAQKRQVSDMLSGGKPVEKVAKLAEKVLENSPKVDAKGVSKDVQKDASETVNVQVPSVEDCSKLAGLVNIHFHFAK